MHWLWNTLIIDLHSKHFQLTFARDPIMLHELLKTSACWIFNQKVIMDYTADTEHAIVACWWRLTVAVLLTQLLRITALSQLVNKIPTEPFKVDSRDTVSSCRALYQIQKHVFSLKIVAGLPSPESNTVHSTTVLLADLICHLWAQLNSKTATNCPLRNPCWTTTNIC